MAPNSPSLAQDAPTTAPRHPNVYMYNVSLRYYDGMKGIVYPYHTCVLHVQKKLTSMPCNDGSDDARLMPLLIILMVGQEDKDADDKPFGATELPDISLQHF